MNQRQLETVARQIVDTILVTVALESLGVKVVSTEVKCDGRLHVEVEVVKPVRLDHIELKMVARHPEAGDKLKVTEKGKADDEKICTEHFGSSTPVTDGD